MVKEVSVKCLFSGMHLDLHGMCMALRKRAQASECFALAPEVADDDVLKRGYTSIPIVSLVH